MDQTRAQSDPAFQWRLTDIFESNEAWEKEFQAAQARVAALPEHSGKLTASADALLAALTAQSGVSQSVERLYCYAHMRRDEDNGNTLYQGLMSSANGSCTDVDVTGVTVVNTTNVKTVQEVLGHENLNTTQICTHIGSTELKIAAEANPLSKLDFSKNES